MRQLIPWNGVQTSQIRHLQSSKVWLGIPCDAKAAFLDGHAGSSTSGNDDRHVQGFLLPKSWSRKSFLRDDSHHGHHVQCDHVCVWTCAFDAVFVFEENNAYYLASYKITRCF